MEYSIKIAASLAKLCADSGHTIDIITGETPLRNAGWQEAMNYLARLKVGGKSTLVKLTTAPEPSQIVVAIVPAMETELVPTLLQLADRVWGLVVVLLEDFTPDETPSGLLSGLERRNLKIITCCRGNLKTAVKKLGNSLVFTGRIPEAVV